MGRCKEWRHTLLNNSLDEYNCLRLCTVWCLLVWMEIDVRPEMIIMQWDSNRWQKQIRWALINCYKYPRRQRQSKLVNLEARRDRESAVKLCTPVVSLWRECFLYISIFIAVHSGSFHVQSNVKPKLISWLFHIRNISISSQTHPRNEILYK